MKLTQGLHALAMGDSSLEEGAAAVRDALRSSSTKDRGALLFALRAWVFRALRTRRKRSDFEGWIELFSRVSAQFEGLPATKIEAYLELLQMASARGEADAGVDLLKGKHARAVLATLRAAGGRMMKTEMLGRLGLKQANLTYVMAPLLDGGLVASEQVGKHRVYILTAEGRRRLEERLPSRRATEVRIRNRVAIYADASRLHLADASYGVGNMNHLDVGVVHLPFQDAAASNYDVALTAFRVQECPISKLAAATKELEGVCR